MNATAQRMGVGLAVVLLMSALVGIWAYTAGGLPHNLFDADQAEAREADSTRQPNTQAIAKATSDKPTQEYKPFDLDTHQKVVVPFFNKHCVSCHGPDAQEGDLRLDTLPADLKSVGSARHWVEIMDNLNRGDMPPPDEKRPDLKELTKVTHWIAREIRHVDKLNNSTGGHVVMRRLNRAEYANTIRDLLQVEFLPGEGPLALLPADGTAEGFDKVSKALMLDPSLMEKYFQLAQMVANKAIVEGPPEFPTKTVRYEYEETKTYSPIRYQCTNPSFRCNKDHIVVMAGGARSFGKLMYGKTRRMIPTRGRYKIRVRAWADPGKPEKPVRLIVRRGPDSPIVETLVDARADRPKIYEFEVVYNGPGGNEISASIGEGTNFGQISRPYLDLNGQRQKSGKKQDYRQVLIMESRMLSEGVHGLTGPNPNTVDITNIPKLCLDYIELEGPIIGDWPPASHTSLLVEGDAPQKPLESARKVFTQFLPKAYRRPIDPREVEPIVKLVSNELERGASFPKAMRSGLVGVLTSPNFLYIAEPTVAPKTGPLNDYQLANRLSFFLWSSMPDKQLFDLAAQKKLNSPAELSRQVDRMLADPKALALQTGFATQWLRTDDFRNFEPDKRMYKKYNEKIGEDMVAETLAFFNEILTKDLSTLNFIDSDFAMLNQRLADFYGIPGVTGEEFRRVQLPADSHRGGLLTQAGVLLYGSDGTRTKPVTRGVYVREVLFNDPPDPPPANVGEVEPNIKGKNLSVRDRLLQHQKIASCAACHRSIDPFGLALENYNVIGLWRTKQDGEGFRPRRAPDIIAEGKLPNGKEFSNPEEFKQRLLEQKDRFARGLAEKMIVYAMGRPVEISDRTWVDGLAQHMTKNNYTFRSLIKSLVVSKQFRSK